MKHLLSEKTSLRVRMFRKPSAARVLMLLTLFCGLAGQARGQQFSVSGSTIRDPSGNTFIPVGANVGGEKYAWGRTTASSTELRAIKDVWKLNTIRTNHYAIRSTTRSGSPLQSGSSLADVVAMYTPHRIVVMEELHDFTGPLFEEMTSSEEQQLKDYWRAKAIEYKDNPYVWFNIMNEPGGSINSAAYYDKWVSLHRSIISIIRAQGANNIIVIDGMWFGQDAGNSFDSDNILDSESAILSRGPEILAGNSNIVFSVHTYAQWGGGTESRLANFIDRVKAKGLALLIGEAGASAGSTTKWKAGARFGFAVSKQKNVGILAWHWQPGDDFDLTTGGDGWGKSVNSETNLTEYGQYLWDRTHTTSCTAPIAPGSLSLTVASSSQINLSWTDNSTIEQGFKIERKQGSTGTYTQIASVGANVTTYQSTGLSASTTYYYRVRSYNGTCHSAYAAEKSATTQAGSSTGSNLLVNPGFESGSLSPWSGTQVYISGSKRTGSYGARLGSSGGASATLQQTVTGLKPGTTYTVRAWLRVAGSGISVQLGVDGYGSSKTATAVTGTSYTQSSLSFTTGSSNTSVRIYVAKPSTSTTLAYADDFELVEGTGTSARIAASATDAEPAELSVRVFPNPVTGAARLSIVPSAAGTYHFSLYGPTGQQVYGQETRLETIGPVSLTIPMERLPAGVYLLRITGNGRISYQKVIKGD